MMRVKPMPCCRKQCFRYKECIECSYASQPCKDKSRILHVKRDYTASSEGVGKIEIDNSRKRVGS